MPFKLVVLISGNGSNLQAILDACSRGDLPAVVAAVISNKADAFGLVRAKNAGVPAVDFPKHSVESRGDYDARLAKEAARWEPDYIVLAGWMRMLTTQFLEKFPGKVINLHPALPGMFAGTHAIQRAYEAYLRAEIDHSGVMVHLVPDEGMDNGPVLATQDVFFLPQETPESFETRMHTAEHHLLVNTLKNLLSDH